MLKTYAAINKNSDVLMNSSSGGVFYELAKYVLDKNGVVFGAAWNKDWLVDMKYVDNINDLSQLMKSKYVKANLKNTFKECKNFLDEGKLVLYSGTSCQLLALKLYLKQSYNNLILACICCHGTMPVNIWQDYLSSIERKNNPITNIDFRSKDKASWEDYNIIISYSNGDNIVENHNDNRYFKAFLSDKYLNANCYQCQCKSKNDYPFDFMIGDYWGVKNIYPQISYKNGVSFISCNSLKAESILNTISSNLTLIESRWDDVYKRNGGLHVASDKNRSTYNSNIFSKKVGIVTLHLNKNIGGCLQAYALQKTISKFGYDSEVLTWNDNNLMSSHLPFVDSHIKCRFLDQYKKHSAIKESDYDIFVVGSDQIWRREFDIGDHKNNYIKYPFLEFTEGWTKTRFSYAASVGVCDKRWEYTEDDNKKLTKILNNYNAVSVRESKSVADFKDRLDIEAKWNVDPTMLLSKDEYLELADNDKKTEGIFSYILDKSSDKSNFINNISSKLSLPITTSSNNVSDWLAHFRDCKLVITDSFHGCIFSIIFNKPFIYFKNNFRGLDRFNTLEEKFNISDRCINEGFKWDNSLLSTPDIDYSEYIQDSLSYIETNLKANPIKMKLQSKLVLPDANSRKAWLCFISSNNYVYYALHLYKTLIDTGTKYPLYCGVTKNVSEDTRNILKTVGVNLLELDTTDVEHSGIVQRGAKAGMCQKYINALTKLDLFKFDDKFDKVVYLDVDLHVFQNIDELFDKPHMSAVEDVAPIRKHYAYKPGDSIFCSGLVVWDFKNNKGLIQKIISELDKLPEGRQWHDQNILNYYYPNWINDKHLHLDPTYGLMVCNELLQYYNMDKPKIRHYVQSGKEWMPFYSTHTIPRSSIELTRKLIIRYYLDIAESIKYFNKAYDLNIKEVNTSWIDGQDINKDNEPKKFRSYLDLFFNR